MKKSLFDRFASWVATWVAKAWFFGFCVVLVLVWVPSLPLVGSVDTWQLIINTVTTIITFLLLALLHNTSQQAEDLNTARFHAIMLALGIVDPEEEGNP